MTHTRNQPYRRTAPQRVQPKSTGEGAMWLLGFVLGGAALYAAFALVQAVPAMVLFRLLHDHGVPELPAYGYLTSFLLVLAVSFVGSVAKGVKFEIQRSDG